MRKKDSRTEALSVEYTDKPLSGWGGTVAFFRFAEAMGLNEHLDAALPDGRTSPNQVPVRDIIKGFMCSVLLGGSRFDHVNRIREDAVLKAILGAKRMGSSDTLRRYLNALTRGQSDSCSRAMSELTNNLYGDRTEDILDLDSTVNQRYGYQEGATKGYNPVHPGRRSLHPYLAMFAESKIIPHAWMRAGAAATQRGVIPFMDEILERLPENLRIRLLRADSGFTSVRFLEYLENKRIHYLIALKSTASLIKHAHEISTWIPTPDQRQEVGEMYYKPSQWRSARRVIVVRRRMDPADPNQLLLPVTEALTYEYSALVTNSEVMTLHEAIVFYNGRGDCENRIKELKYDYNIAGFSLQSFNATEVAFRLICLLHNLVSAFRTTILGDSTLTLGTIRHKVFVVGAQLGSSARTQILRLGLRGKWRPAFETLLRRVASATRSTAAQIRNQLQTKALPPPDPWRRRPLPPVILALR